MDTFEALQLKQGLVAGDDGVGSAGGGAFQNAVIGLIGSRRYAAGGPHPLGQLFQPDSHARQFFAVAAELAGQYAKKLIQNRFGKKQTIFAFNHAS